MADLKSKSITELEDRKIALLKKQEIRLLELNTLVSMVKEVNVELKSREVVTNHNA